MFHLGPVEHGAQKKIMVADPSSTMISILKRDHACPALPVGLSEGIGPGNGTPGADFSLFADIQLPSWHGADSYTTTAGLRHIAAPAPTRAQKACHRAFSWQYPSQTLSQQCG